MADQVSPSALKNTIHQILDLAIDGAPQMPGAKLVAAKQLGKHPHVNEAIDAVVTSHIATAGTQGFLTNVGGLVTTAIALPINLVGLMMVQCRMVASIAHLRGYDIDDSRVRAAIMMCLIGDDDVKRLVRKGKLPGSPLVVATAPVVDPSLTATVAERVINSLLTTHGGKAVGVLATKRIPIIGGGIGAAYDAFATRQVGQYAKSELVQRRALA